MGEKAGDGVGSTDVIVAETPRGERSPPIGTAQERNPHAYGFIVFVKAGTLADLFE
jgi:hypothetical protein